jgi:AraC family transcriptional regulator, regulatory protein of adaptative response / methylated-DNA-[protein]-cysteine methyltransferase
MAGMENDMKGKNDDDMWQALLNRDFRFFSSFVYAVKSSGIFCRPTCPSRKPAMREAVEFFSTASRARQAGFRACRRCKPEADDDLPSNVAAVQKVCTYIEENFASKISLAQLAEVSGQSPFYLHRNFRKLTGVTPRQYVEAVRLKHAKLALKRGDSIRNSTYRAGHSSAAWLYAGGSSARFGMTPSSYKAGGEGLTISYSVKDCTLGKLLIASTAKGICFVCLGASTEELTGYLREEYPRAQLASDDGNSLLNRWVAEILAYLDGGNRLDSERQLPVDVAATAFQMRVWEELRQIPYGGTRSYEEIAERVGKPTAYRAVANACGANKLPLLIPCHRVVRKNGDLGGYRYGVDRKKKLLQLEAERRDEKS